MTNKTIDTTAYIAAYAKIEALITQINRRKVETEEDEKKMLVLSVQNEKIAQQTRSSLLLLEDLLTNLLEEVNKLKEKDRSVDKLTHALDATHQYLTGTLSAADFMITAKNMLRSHSQSTAYALTALAFLLIAIGGAGVALTPTLFLLLLIKSELMMVAGPILLGILFTSALTGVAGIGLTCVDLEKNNTAMTLAYQVRNLSFFPNLMNNDSHAEEILRPQDDVYDIKALQQPAV